jgi:hypothetical protein
MTTKFRVLKTAELNYTTRGASQEACHDAFIHHLPPTPAPSLTVPGTIDYTKTEYTNTKRDLTVGDSYIMKGFLATGVSFAQKQQRVCPYFQDFGTSSS